MKIFKTIVKAALSVAAVMAMGLTDSSGNPDVFSAIVMFAVIYGLITYYMFSFANSDGFFVGNGLISMAFALILNLGLPLLAIIIPMFILQALLGEIGMIIFGIVVLIVCAGCILGDVVNIVRMFHPGFLGGFGDFFDHSLKD